MPSIELTGHGREWHTMDYDYIKQTLIVCGGNLQLSTDCLKLNLNDPSESK
jgi:hypothetical protein